MVNPKEILDLAIKGAKQAGEIQKNGLGKIGQIGYKGPKNLVTDIDHLCEKTILNIITEKYPEHGILAEETGAYKPKSPYRWIVDPLDGTTNYAHAYPCFCVSIAFEAKGEILTGVVYQPVLDELFFAMKGEGAWVNRDRIYVSKTDNLEQSLLATGRLIKKDGDTSILFSQFKRILTKAQAVRIDGSAALNICYVATGRYDGFWEFGLKPWDTAAGILILKEAAGLVTDFSGEDFYLSKNNLIASNRHIHQALIDNLQK